MKDVDKFRAPSSEGSMPLDEADEAISDYATFINEELEESSIKRQYSILVGKEREREITVSVVQMPENLPGFRQYYLAAHSDGSLLGIKEFGYSLSIDNDYYAAGGHTVVYEEERGKGIGFALELAAVDLAQTDANELNLPIHWGVADANSVGLKKLTEKASTIEDTRLGEEVVAKKQKERERWENLYSRLGFVTNPDTGNPRKEFRPQVGVNPKDDVDLILSYDSEDEVTTPFTSSNPIKHSEQEIKATLGEIIRPVVN